MTLPRFDLQRPPGLQDALAARSEDDIAFAGGTEILLAMRMGLIAPQSLIDVKRIEELQGIEDAGTELVIGAASTHDQVARSVAVRDHQPMLAGVAEHVGNPRVRAQGTIGGNIVFAEPKSDVIAALIALDASVELASANENRSLSVADFVLGPYWADVADDELLIRIRIPLVEGRRAAYEKFQTMERPTVGVAARVDADGSALVVVAAVCGEPESYPAASLDEVDPEAIAEQVDVIEDLTGGERYKRHLTAVIVRRAVARLREME